MTPNRDTASLVALAARGLEAMWDPPRQTLLTRSFADGVETRNDHLSARYCVMAALGVHRARAAGVAVSLEPAHVLARGLADAPPEALDELAMGLWADAELGTLHAETLLPRLLSLLADPKTRERSLGRPLAWALTGLSLHHAQTGDAQARAAADELARFCRERCFHGRGRLFRHVLSQDSLLPPQSLFSTQIYWVFALATYGRIARDAACIEVAAEVMRRLVDLRDPMGGWAWRYDAESGRVPEPFPIYAVHQHGMAPMALHLLGELGALDPASALRESLGWLWHNQLGLDLVDVQRAVIYRAIRRRFPINRLAYTAGRVDALQSLTRHAAFLKLNATCRPYELGWLLYAWAGRPNLEIR